MLKFAFLATVLIGLVTGLDVDSQKKISERLSSKLLQYNSFGLPEVSQRYQPEFAAKSAVAATNAPISCYNRSIDILPHDGTAQYGDLVESDFSSTCSDTFTFYVDNFIDEFFVIITTLDALNPRATVYNPIGGEVSSCKDYASSATQSIHLICNGKNIHGTGAYTVKLAADMNKPCIFEIRAPTKLTVDGGFVEDIRDDDVQQIILSTANQGIFRFPLENQASYLAFKVESEEFPIHPEEVHLYTNGQFDIKMDLNLRYGCNTPHITQQSYNCTSQNLYHAKFRGYDSDGNRFQRIYDFNCDIGDVVFTTPSVDISTTPARFCENGGILYNDTAAAREGHGQYPASGPGAASPPFSPGTPFFPGCPGGPGRPAFPGFPASPSFPGAPGFPAGPASPRGPCGPGLPGCPGLYSVPGSPRGPGGPGRPAAPGLPASPCSPGPPCPPGGPGGPRLPFPPAGPADPGPPAGPFGPGRPGGHLIHPPGISWVIATITPGAPGFPSSPSFPVFPFGPASPGGPGGPAGQASDFGPQLHCSNPA